MMGDKIEMYSLNNDNQGCFFSPANKNVEKHGGMPPKKLQQGLFCPYSTGIGGCALLSPDLID
jgi:hypothetical protein